MRVYVWVCEYVYVDVVQCRVCTGVGHRQDAGFVVFDIVPLICERLFRECAVVGGDCGNGAVW